MSKTPMPRPYPRGIILDEHWEPAAWLYTPEKIAKLKAEQNPAGYPDLTTPYLTAYYKAWKPGQTYEETMAMATQAVTGS